MWLRKNHIYELYQWNPHTSAFLDTLFDTHALVANVSKTTLGQNRGTDEKNYHSNFRAENNFFRQRIYHWLGKSQYYYAEKFLLSKVLNNPKKILKELCIGVHLSTYSLTKIQHMLNLYKLAHHPKYIAISFLPDSLFFLKFNLRGGKLIN
jgi:hypothetical protein